MSHKVRTKFKVTDINTARRACESLGYQMDQSGSFVLWGSRRETCDYTIRVPGQRFEIGMTKEEDGTYRLEYDHFLQGHGIEDFCVAYSLQAIKDEQMAAGFDIISDEETEDEIILELEIL